MEGKLTYYYGSMGSGKSLQLLATAHNFQIHHIPFLIFKSSIDNRDGENVIHSRALGNRECVSVTPDNDIYKIVAEYIQSPGQDTIKFILVDEAQFLTEEQVEQLAAICDNLNIDVTCYGLKTDFRSRLFPGSKRLFELADSFEEIKSACYCGGKTSINARMNNNKELVVDGSQIEVGGDDKYIALCRKCYFERIGYKYWKKEKENEDNF